MTIDGARFGHVNVTSHDWRRLAAFYTDVFGCVFVPPERDIRSADLDAATGLHDAHLTGAHLRLPGHGDTGPTLEIFSYDALEAIPARGSTVQAGAISPSRCRMSRPPSTRSWQPVEAGTATSSPPGRPTAARSPGSTPPTRTAISSNCRRGRPPRPGNDAARRAPVADDPRRRARDRARATWPRPLRSTVVGPPAAGRPGGDRGRPPRVPPGWRPRIDDGELPGDDPGLRRRRPGPVSRARSDPSVGRGRAPGARPIRARGHRCRSPDPRVIGGGLCRSIRRDARRRVGVPRRLRPRRGDAARRPRPADGGPARGRRRPAGDRDDPRRCARRACWSISSPSSGATAWLSYQCRDGATTAAGEPIEDAVALASTRGVVAVGVNCTAPRHVPALLAAAAAGTPKPLIAYPNDGDTWDAHDRRWVATDLRRSVRRNGGRFVDRAWRGLARWLLRDGPDGYRRLGGRYRRVLIRPR